MTLRTCSLAPSRVHQRVALKCASSMISLRDFIKEAISFLQGFTSLLKDELLLFWISLKCYPCTLSSIGISLEYYPRTYLSMKLNSSSFLPGELLASLLTGGSQPFLCHLFTSASNLPLFSFYLSFVLFYKDGILRP